MGHCLIYYILLVTVYMIQGAYNEQEVKLRPVADFSHHTIVKPKIYHGREKREILTTKQKNGEHISHLQIMLEIEMENLILDLILNTQIILKDFFLQHQENGEHVVYRPTKEEMDHCHYNGKVRGHLDSWVAISTCDGLSGVIFTGLEMYYLEKGSTVNNTSVENEHFIFKHSNLVELNKTCGYDEDTKGHDHSALDNIFHRYRRSTKDKEHIRGPNNINKESKYVELVIVVDKSEYENLGKSSRTVIDHCKKLVNVLNGLYAPLNIFISLVGVVIWSTHNKITFSANSARTLDAFLQYRREKLVFNYPNDNAQLLTKFQFDNGVVGKATSGQMCSFEHSGGIITDHSPIIGLVASTMAHEIGHNFGMEHDTAECECPKKHCIMAPSVIGRPTHWSMCSLNSLLLAFTHGVDYCLRNKPDYLFDSVICGNGFVEHGEECDCGLPEYCENKCCNATTCMLYANASCATGECCDLMTCSLKNAGTLCRSADSFECDLPEYCTGQSEYCPNDFYKEDAILCGKGDAFCYHGLCRSRNDQCRLIWGETGKSSFDQCYETNTYGNISGNCGYNRFYKSYLRCGGESVLCGRLYCQTVNTKIVFGLSSYSMEKYIFDQKSLIKCHSATIDLGIDQIDPGLTPDGAKCGEGKMCLNQKCIDVLSLKQQLPNCEKGCNAEGWCNNKGHCHCKDGFAPPFCTEPGPGGSKDSGPASDPNDKTSMPNNRLEDSIPWSTKKDRFENITLTTALYNMSEDNIMSTINKFGNSTQMTASNDGSDNIPTSDSTSESGDSVSASDPNEFSAMQVAIFTIFLGIVSTLALITYCKLKSKKVTKFTGARYSGEHCYIQLNDLSKENVDLSCPLISEVNDHVDNREQESISNCGLQEAKLYCDL